MKNNLIVILLVSSIFVAKAQVTGLQINDKKEKRSLSMFFNNLDEGKKCAVFINGEQRSFIELQSINQKLIGSYIVEKKSIKIKSKEYQEQLYIVTKDNYQPKRISLKEIRKKNVKMQNLPCVYFVDGSLVNIDEENIFLDENNILEICCHLFNAKENLKLNIIEIFTKSDKNIEAANTMIIR
ncbi:hypothetical protein V3Q90_10650 [Flavobacterium oreochromis]|uniref:hypothetical protein n=1 Tax=Flavobacterium oreochromis TaxID=2906078 RepID=UPI00385BAE31